MKDKDVTILLPALNEASSIGSLVRGIVELAEVLVVDNGSVDGTGDIAKEEGAKVLNVQVRGKGCAVKEGIKVINTPYIIMSDSDGTYPIFDYFYTILFSLRLGCDVVMGGRFYNILDRPHAFSLLNLIGNIILSKSASFLYKRDVPDLCTGLWGFRKSFLDSFEIKSKGFTLEAEFFINACRLGANIGYVPIMYLPREDSTAKLKKWDGFRILWYLVKNKDG